MKKILSTAFTFADKTTKFFIKNDDLYIVLVSILIGVLAGYGNIFFRYLITICQDIFYGGSNEAMLYILQKQPFYKILFFPAIGGLLVGLIGTLFKSAKGHGIPDVIKAVILNKKIHPVVALTKTISSSITIGSGGSAGREGPIVQIGAAIGSGVGRLLKFSGNRLKAALACGAAGGLASTFNAPMGGAMFAAEIIVGEFTLTTFTPIIVSSVVATVISRAYLGNDVTFIAPAYHLINPVELVFYALMGFILALLGVLFIKFYYFFENRFISLKIPPFLKPALGGLLLGIIALYSRRIMGVGYATIEDILYGRLTADLLFILIFLKMIATTFTLSSGGSGGLFVPSLLIGAATGGFFGSIMHLIFPNITAYSGAYGLVAMSGMLAATMRAPLTSILIIFEITQSYEIILPLMLTSIIANFVANWFENESIFTYTLTKEGVMLKRNVEESILSNIKVRDVMLKDNLVTFRKQTPFEDILKSLQKADHMYFPIVDAENNLIGMLSLDDIKSVLFDESLKKLLLADDICRKKDLVYINPDNNLNNALGKMVNKDLGAIPVIQPLNGKLKLVGLLRRSDVMAAYNKAYMSQNVKF